MRPRKDRHRFANHIFKCILLNENAWLLIEISLKFVPDGPINIIAALVQIMAWRRPGDKPLSEQMMFNFNGNQRSMPWIVPIKDLHIYFLLSFLNT